MTPEQQWEVMNVASFDAAVLGKVKAVRTSMAQAEVEADEIRTNVQDVPVKFYQEGELIFIEVGNTADNRPQAEMKIPSIWLEA